MRVNLPLRHYGVLMTVRRVGLPPRSIEQVGESMDFIDPDNVPDMFVAGCAWIEPLPHGMVRIWAYSEEQGVRIIRVKLVLPTSRAREINHFIRGELEKLSTLRLVR